MKQLPLLVFIISMFFINNLAKAESFINICGRGNAISGAIVRSIYRTLEDHMDSDRTLSCDRVSVTKMQKLKELDVFGFCNRWSCREDAGVVAASDFVGLTSLETLDLSFSELTKISDGAFDNLTNLKKLVLSQPGRYYGQPSFGIKPFKNLKNLKILHLNDMQLNNSAGFSSNYLNQKDFFTGLNSLEELELMNSQIQELNKDIFKNLVSLKSLSLYKNEFLNLPQAIFSNLKSLENLDLSYNKFDEIPQGTFLGLDRLKNLWLYFTGLEPVSRSRIGISDDVKVDIPTTP